MVPVIIPFYKNQEQLDRCIDHLKQQTLPVEIFIRDNNKDNVFFTKAVNEGLRHFLDHDCDYLIILNQDMYLEPDAVQAMVTFMDQHPQCGIGSPLEHICSMPANHVLSGGKQCFPHGVHDVGLIEQLRQSDEIIWANGSCLILRKTMIREIGLLDENFVFLASDSDYCFTARTRGWQVWRIGTALGHHEHGASGESDDPNIELLKVQDMLHFAKKWINGGLYHQIAHTPEDHNPEFIARAIEDLKETQNIIQTYIENNAPTK